MTRICVASVEEVATLAGVSDARLVQIAESTRRRYAVCEVENEIKKRTLEIPDGVLMPVQRAILHRLFSHFPISLIDHGNGHGRDHFTAASMHVGHRWIGSFDIEAFFESVRSPQIRLALERELEAPSKVINVLLRLVALNGRLPTGAPTSPRIAGLVLREVDGKIIEVGRMLGVTVTRYVDDVIFSGERRGDVQRALNDVRLRLLQLGLRENRRKGWVRRRGERQVVHGLSIAGELSIPQTAPAGSFSRKRVYDELRRIRRYGASPEEVLRVNGWIAYIARLHPIEAERMRDSLQYSMTKAA